MLDVLAALIQMGQPPPYEPWRIGLTIGGSLVTFTSLALTAYVLMRTKTATYWKEERDVAVIRADRLEKDKRDLVASCAEKDVELAKLKALPDLRDLTEAIMKLEAVILQNASHVVQLITDNNRMVMGFQSQNAAAFESFQTVAQEMTRTLAAMREELRASKGGE